jgi:DNA-binding transcriptional LysR family regulator
MHNTVLHEQQSQMIEPNDLWLFASIADCGSFSKAAQITGLPKSSLSRRIARMEQRLGERLLQRTTRKLALTEFGQHLLAHGRQIGEETSAAIAWAAHRQLTPSGRLRISMPGDLANLLLTPLLAQFAQRYADVALVLDLSPRRVDLLAEGFDLAIRAGDLPDDASLAAKRLMRNRFGLFAAPAYLATREPLLHPQQLVQHAGLHLVAAHQEAAPWRLSCGEQIWQGLPPAAISANSPELLVNMARLGCGIAAAPWYYARAAVAEGALVPVLPDWHWPDADIWAVFPGRKLMPGKTRAFLDFLAENLPQ